ncbi:MAG: hypothetical protein AMS24_03330 [Chlamydiae bacterium SM23_39]|nr:MAG: hypothetical protein AMS24_03330 [Chlamydiae bacterium SM23_39]
MTISLLTVYFILGIITAYFAKKINKNPYLWFSIGMIFGIFGLIIIFLMSLKNIKNSKSNIKHHPIEDSKLWYYLNNDKSQGPHSLTKLIDLFHEKKVFLNTYVWNEELEDWKHLKDTKEFLKIEKKLPASLCNSRD